MTGMLLVQGSASHLPLSDESVQCVVTSPPYWGLRQYAGEQREVWGGDTVHAHEWGEAGQRVKGGFSTGRESVGLTNPMDSEVRAARDAAQVQSTGAFCACGAWYGALGLEPTPELYVEHMVAIFREVRRVLRKDGTLWLNLGDSYAQTTLRHRRDVSDTDWAKNYGHVDNSVSTVVSGMKPKDLCGIPWMVAFALRADGWYLRSDIIWSKPNPMPESVTDRPTKAHEYLFLLSKSQSYYYDQEAIRLPVSPNWTRGGGAPMPELGEHVLTEGRAGHQAQRVYDEAKGANRRTVWTIATRPYPGAHFATYPEQLVEPCILAGSAAKACGVCGAPWERQTETTFVKTQANNFAPEHRGFNIETRQDVRERGRNEVATTGWTPTCAHQDGTGTSLVLDPFNGSGTTGRVAIRHGRNYVGLDISDEYLVQQARKRIDNIQHVMGGL